MSTAAPEPALAVFDEPALLEITVAAGIPPLELIAMFVADCQDQITRMETALAQGDQKTVHRHLHTVKSSAANAGAMRFGDLARSLEMASRNQLPVDLFEGLAGLRTELKLYRQATDARRPALTTA